MTELEAELYALTHRGNPGDLKFYGQACAGAGRVLELGTGYGRLLPVLLAEGRHVVGLDREPQLLRAARRRAEQLRSAQRARLRLVRGDMQRLELGAEFDRILLPYNGLYCLPGRRALESCLRGVRAHLAPGGQFVFDVWAADRFARSARSSAHRDDDEAIVSFAHRGQTWDVFEQSRLASGAQRLDVTYTYVSRERGRRVICRIEQRYASSRELTESIEAAGLRVRARWGGFAEQPFRRGSEQLVVVATR